MGKRITMRCPMCGGDFERLEEAGITLRVGKEYGTRLVYFCGSKRCRAVIIATVQKICAPIDTPTTK